MDEQVDISSATRGRWVLPAWMTARFIVTSSAGALALWLGIFFFANGIASDTGDTWVQSAVNSQVYRGFFKVVGAYFAIGMLVTLIQQAVAKPPAQSAAAQRTTKAVGSIAKVAVIGVGIFLALAFATLIAIAIAAGA